MLLNIIILQFIIKSITTLFFVYPKQINLKNEIGIGCIFNFSNIDSNKVYWYKNNILQLNQTLQIINNTYILKIKNITINDLNSTYKCVYNNTQQTNTIKFIYKPKKEDFKILYFSNVISLYIFKIYPIPKCYMDIPKNYYIDKTVINNNKLYYEVRMYFNYTHKKECGQNKTIFCTLSNKKFNLKIVTEKCYNDSYEVKKINNNKLYEVKKINIMLFIIVSVILCSLILIIYYIVTFILFIIRKKKRRTKFHKINYYKF